jgi:hypothetical protein
MKFIGIRDKVARSDVIGNRFEPRPVCLFSISASKLPRQHSQIEGVKRWKFNCLATIEKLENFVNEVYVGIEAHH